METRASHVLIGVFALTVVLLAVAFVLWMGKSSLDRDFDEYDIVFREAVTGLTVGGAVQYNGIQIGEVRRLSLDPDDPGRVVAHVRVTAGTPVRVDTRAKLTFTGLTGVALIQLSGGGKDAAPLAPAPGQRHGVIVADDSALQKLMASGEDMVMRANELLSRLTRLLDDANLERVATSLANVETLTGAVAGSSDDVARTLADLARASRALNATLAHADALVARLDEATATTQALIDGEGRQALVEVRDALAAVRRVAAQGDAVLAANRDALDGLGSQGLTQLAPALAETRAALRRLNVLADRLEHEPARFLLGRDAPRERALH